MEDLEGQGDSGDLEADSGLDLLFPLYSFLHNTAKQAVCRLLITSFGDAQYVQENRDKCVKPDMTFYSFLCHINQTIKDIKKEGKNSKNKRKKKKSSSLLQVSCSNQWQQQHHYSRHHQHTQVHSGACHSRGQQCPPCLNQHTSHTQGCRSAPCQEEPICNMLYEIQNVADKEKILVQVTVSSLLQKDENMCRPLHELDVNFVVSVIMNELIKFKLAPEVKDALTKLKKVRQVLVHSKYIFTEHDFDKNLACLVHALTIIYQELHLPDQLLQQRIEFCQEEARSGNKVHDILRELRLEAHQQYSLDPTFVPPIISCSQMVHTEVIEDLQKFIENQQNNLDPMLLCGEHKDEKTRILERLAWQGRNSQSFNLVLYLKDSYRRRCYHQANLMGYPQSAAQEFQNQVFACLASLVPNTLYKYGLDAIKAAVRLYQRRILFLLDWNVSSLGPVQSAMERGSWVISCSARRPSQGSWQVLRVAPYTELQVREMLQHHPDSAHLLDRYDNFDDKDILSSLDMIKMFCEVSQTVCSGTDFEVVEAYLSRTVQQTMPGKADCDLVSLGRLAFDALCSRRFAFKESSINGVQKCLCDSLLYFTEMEGWSFKHSVVRDFLAARYVVSDSSVACKNWLKKDENVVAFKRVFRFVCYMWFQHNSVSKEKLNHMETFLRALLHVPEKKESKQCDKEAKSSDKKSNRMKKREAAEEVNKHKNPFDSWAFLMELDKACNREGLERIVSILSDIPCWRFNVSDCLDTINLTRLQKVLKNISLDKKDPLDPLIIKLKSNSNVTLLIKLWSKLRGIKRLYGCVNFRLTIEGDNASHFSYRDMLEDLLRIIADTQVPLYITCYKGPFFSSSIPSFFKCTCMQRLEILEVSVCDVKSLCEVMAHGTLPSLKEVFIRVNLELREQINLKAVTIEVPKDISVHITFQYFPQIQQLLNSFTNCHHMCSLSIHGLYIFEDFKLNLEEFSNLESLSLRFKPEYSGDRTQVPERERMEVEAKNWLSRRHWMMPLLHNLILPQEVERLLLRNVEFLNDSNQHFIFEFFQQFNINRLIILDTRLTLAGVGKILHSQTGAEADVDQGGGKRLRRNEPPDIWELASRRTRIPKEKREAMKWRKPEGKEVLITSDGSLCADCSCFPCMCSSKLDQDGPEGYNSYERMVVLINAMRRCNILTFSYSFDKCTIRKDVCGDLRVHCIMKCLTDTAAFEIESRSCLTRFFLPLMLAQSITLEQTALTPAGLAAVANHLRRIKGGDTVEPFSLTVETSWHPVENTALEGIKRFLQSEMCLSVVYYQCGCSPKHFQIKKTYQGQIKDEVQFRLS